MLKGDILFLYNDMVIISVNFRSGNPVSFRIFYASTNTRRINGFAGVEAKVLYYLRKSKEVRIRVGDLANYFNMGLTQIIPVPLVHATTPQPNNPHI